MLAPEISRPHAAVDFSATLDLINASRGASVGGSGEIRPSAAFRGRRERDEEGPQSLNHQRCAAEH